jgi:hypothetical protein
VTVDGDSVEVVVEELFFPVTAELNGVAEIGGSQAIFHPFHRIRFVLTER